MKLLLRRDQRSSTFGKVTFYLDVRAELGDDEMEHIAKYRLEDTKLYEKFEITDRGSGLLGFASYMAFKMMNLTITVGDLVSGKRVECKDIVEMLAAEEQIRTACQTFKRVLDAAAQFGGEEVLALE